LERHAAVEHLKKLIITNELPQTDMALFGIKCPYFGKSDRIHKLESPDDLPQSVSDEDTEQYGTLWYQLNPDASLLGVCKFCLNPSELLVSAGQAKVLVNR
jgi:hypothetical protein